MAIVSLSCSTNHVHRLSHNASENATTFSENATILFLWSIFVVFVCINVAICPRHLVHNVETVFLIC